MYIRSPESEPGGAHARAFNLPRVLKPKIIQYYNLHNVN